MLNIYKPQGLTPLQTIKKVREKYPKYKDKKIGYAGRLDPMAEGVLLLMVDEETKKRDKYQKLDKTYEFEILFGVETDTYDLLGVVKQDKKYSKKEVGKKELSELIKSYKGKQKQEYPPYSSYRVNGKPLFWWARNNKLSELDIPEKEITIYKIRLTSTYKLKGQVLQEKILEKISHVKGDFRQEKVLKSWKSFFSNKKDKTFKLARLKADVSSGTYIRGLVHKIGQDLNMGATTHSILRSRVGVLSFKNSLQL